MDTTKAITHVSLCAGYGGIDIGLSRAIPSLRTVAFSEIEAFACANLVSKMEAGLLDAAPIWTNLKTFPWAEFRDRVDILSGGYPCQPFSSAGKRLGTEDPRHLWPFIADGIRVMRPRVCFFENVEGHISLGLREVVSELESIGYKVAWGIFSAREVGAPHQRKRVFIMAHRNCQRGQLPNWWELAAESLSFSNGETRRAWPSRPSQPQYGWEPPRVVGDTKHNGSHQRSEETRGQITSSEQGWVQELEGGSASVGDTAMQGSQRRTHGEFRQSNEVKQLKRSNAKSDKWNQTQSSLGRDSNESTRGMDYAELCVSCDNRTDELRLLGNGVVPATAERAFRTLLAELIP